MLVPVFFSLTVVGCIYLSLYCSMSYIRDDVVFLFFFFFKQKTAYEMRISDWSSDVCSSDLSPKRLKRKVRTQIGGLSTLSDREGSGYPGHRGKIGRASCRERVCQYV